MINGGGRGSLPIKMTIDEIHPMCPETVREAFSPLIGLIENANATCSGAGISFKNKGGKVTFRLAPYFSFTLITRIGNKWVRVKHVLHGENLNMTLRYGNDVFNGRVGLNEESKMFLLFLKNRVLRKWMITKI